MKSIRYTSEIRQIIIHHTQHLLSITGKAINKFSVAGLEFGTIYDILIDEEGGVGLSPRWLYALRGSHFKENVKREDIFQTELHHLGAAGDTYFQNKYGLHIGVVGDFNIKQPSIMQLIVLQELLGFFREELPLATVYYHQELSNTPCPGVYFFKKGALIITKVFKQPSLATPLQAEFLGYGFGYGLSYGFQL